MTISHWSLPMYLIQLKYSPSQLVIFVTLNWNELILMWIVALCNQNTELATKAPQLSHAKLHCIQTDTQQWILSGPTLYWAQHNLIYTTLSTKRWYWKTHGGWWFMTKTLRIGEPVWRLIRACFRGYGTSVTSAAYVTLVGYTMVMTSAVQDIEGLIVVGSWQSSNKMLKKA